LVYVNGERICFSLEDEEREVKVSGETRIPAGIYKLRLQPRGRLHEIYKDRFDFHIGMITFINVPNFSGIMFHMGNVDTDTAGCPLLGESVELNRDGRSWIGPSKPAYERFYKLVAPAIAKHEWVECVVRDENWIWS
jgi:hypothetical protein